MEHWLIPLTSAAPARLVGRKAAALGRLIEAGFPVPSGICVTTEAFDAAITDESGNPALPEGLLEALIHAVPTETPLAVRSSSEMEDLPETSQAGRFLTRLNISGAAALKQTVLDCWRSARSIPASGKMAVLIQPMLEAECAGVCFTVDPVRHRTDLLLVSSAWGLGSGVVSGAVPTDITRLRRTDLTIEESIVADKHIRVQRAAAEGVMEYPVPADLRALPCLSENCLRRIGQFGLAIEQLFGAPQDIEWAFTGGQLWILQSRPVTALPAGMREAARFPISWSTAQEPRLFWWLEQANSNAAPLLPAQLDFKQINGQGGQDAVYYGGKERTRFRKIVNGRIYMAAEKSPYSTSHIRVYGEANRALYERLEKQDITWWEYWGPEMLLATRRLAAFDPRVADGFSLADHLEDAIATASRHWMIHTIVPGRPIHPAVILEDYARVMDRPTGELAAEIPFLLSGAETSQTRLIELLYDLACLALESPESARAIVLGQAQAVQPSMQAFSTAFQNLIADFGDRLCHRKMPGFPVDLPLPWREAPEHVWEMIAAYLPVARQGGPGIRQVRLDTQRSVDARVEEITTQALESGKDPAQVENFRCKLAYARRNATFLDEHNQIIDQVSEGQYIQALLYAGRWLAGRGILASAWDIFWLYSSEVLAALRAPAAGLESLLEERRAQFSKWSGLIPPACLGLPPRECQNGDRPNGDRSPAAPSLISADRPANTLVGEPASRGRARGRCRILLENTLPEDFTTGDVIVAPYAGFQLIPFLPAAAAVVLDYGSPGDHFAITAREFGLPAVCATRFATQRIPEGALVDVNAHTGQVTWSD